MNWNLEGKRINGLYMGLFPYSGLVTESRVKYGGKVQHTVKLDETIKVYGVEREFVLVSPEDNEVNRILEENEVA